MSTDPHLEQLRADARYHRDRHALYRARAYGMRPTSSNRLRQLELERDKAQARLEAAEREAARRPAE